MAKDILRSQHKGTNICVRRYWNKTQLLFDDTVVDTWKGIVVKLTPSAVGANIQLTVNGNPVERSWKM